MVHRRRRRAPDMADGRRRRAPDMADRRRHRAPIMADATAGSEPPGTLVATSAPRICRKPGAKIAAVPTPPLSCEFRTRIAFKIHTIMKTSGRGGVDGDPLSLLIARAAVRFHEMSVISSRAFCGRNYGPENCPRPRWFSGRIEPCEPGNRRLPPLALCPHVPQGQSGQFASATRARQTRARVPRG